MAVTGTARMRLPDTTSRRRIAAPMKKSDTGQETERIEAVLESSVVAAGDARSFEAEAHVIECGLLSGL